MSNNSLSQDRMLKELHGITYFYKQSVCLNGVFRSSTAISEFNRTGEGQMGLQISPFKHQFISHIPIPDSVAPFLRTEILWIVFCNSLNERSPC